MVPSYIGHVGCSLRVVQLFAIIIGFFQLGAQSLVLSSCFVAPRSLTFAVSSIPFLVRSPGWHTCLLSNSLPNTCSVLVGSLRHNEATCYLKFVLAPPSPLSRKSSQVTLAIMAALAIPGVTTVNRRPLSTHGLPKPPRTTSSNRPHRFSAHRYPSQQTASDSSIPGSPGPMSPPMSARSFGTFIDSEPSTPAYSPRMDYDWDSSTLVLLRPMSSSSEPSSPTEPVWDMVKPTKSPQQTSGPLPIRHKSPSLGTNKTFSGTQLAPPPTKRTKSTLKPKPLEQIKFPDTVPTEGGKLHDEANATKSPTEHPTGNSAAPLGKLASKMKSMLRRRSAHDKKKEKKEKDYYDPVEVVHWTEM
jgi:hypothetical protein